MLAAFLFRILSLIALITFVCLNCLIYRGPRYRRRPPRRVAAFDVLMNNITWNVRGLGKPAKRFLVRDFLSLHFVDVCCLQESKLDVVSQSLWREIGGCKLDQFAVVPARGTAGGIIL
ncbi:DNase I-like protein [Dioscorea alata]|uniref:DNase I-like protein n=1 Tax=Dioscorea alata TaxID=55571 RepID=A0ACB7VRS2_DIOAL|nr:DNase I-like protein [Dioscorea alata]